MITQQQIDRLKAMAGSDEVHQENGSLDVDALRAAVETLERLPVTRDGVRIDPATTLFNVVGAGYIVEDSWSTECSFYNFDVADCYAHRDGAAAALRKS